jgi:hypothetical protein
MSQRQSVDKTEKKVIEVSLEVADIKYESTELDIPAIKLMKEFQGAEVKYFEKSYNDAIYVGTVKKGGVRHGYGVMKYRNSR